jgi:hypothetical protein
MGKPLKIKKYFVDGFLDKTFGGKLFDSKILSSNHDKI